MQAVRLDSRTICRRLRAGNTVFGRDVDWNMKRMGSQDDPGLVVTSLAACYNMESAEVYYPVLTEESQKQYAHSIVMRG